jgi:hypothetical protein
MTIDGALYRAGVKGVGGYARFTQGEFVAQHEQSKIQEIISEGPERIGSTIDALCENPNRRRFAQALLDAALTLLPASARYVRKQESERARYHKEVARCRPKASRRRPLRNSIHSTMNLRRQRPNQSLEPTAGRCDAHI